MGYMTSYLLLFDQVIRPIAKAIDPNKHTDAERLNTVKNYHGGNFKFLFQELDIDRRNAIMHFNYYFQNEGSMFVYCDRDGNEHPLLPFRWMVLPRILNFFEWEFDPMREQAPLLLGLGEALFGIYDPRYLRDDPNFYAEAAETCAKSEYKKFYRIFWLIEGIQQIKQGNHPEGNKAIQKAMEPEAETTSEELDILLCWFARYGKQVCKGKYRHALRTVMKRAGALFRTLKPSPAQSDFFWALKCYEHDIWGEKKKADSCLAKISKIT